MKKLLLFIGLIHCIYAESVAEESAHERYEAAGRVLTQLNAEIEKYLESQKPVERQLMHITDPEAIEEANYSFQKEMDYYNRSVESMEKLQKGLVEFIYLLEDALASGVEGGCANVIRMAVYADVVKWYSGFLCEQLQLDKEKIEKPILSLSEDANAF